MVILEYVLILQLIDKVKDHWFISKTKKPKTILADCRTVYRITDDGVLFRAV